MSKTLDELVELVAQNVGVLAAGQLLAAEDRVVIKQRIDPTNEMLGNKAVAYIQDLDDIPDAYLLPFAAVVARQCAAPFGITGGKLDQLESDAKTGLRDLYDLSRGRNSRQVLAQENWNGLGYWWRR